MLGILKNKKQGISSQGDGKVVCFMNQKGGVGKTSMAYNSAHALNKLGHKVLCIDMDPQFNLSLLFGETQSPENNIFHLMVNSIRELKSLHSGVLLSEVIKKSDTGVDYIPAGQDLSGFELTVAGINAPRQLILKKFIEKNDLLKMYDYIIIDGPPTLGLIVVNILCASQGVVFPFIPDSFSQQGLRNIKEVILDIEDMGIVETPKILGYIPNLYEGRRKNASLDLEKIKEEVGEEKFFDPFYNRVHLSRSMSSKKSVFSYEAAEFRELQEKFLSVAKSIEQELE